MKAERSVPKVNMRAAWCILAWNAWRNGDRLRKVQWRPGGARPDPFPMIDGLDYASVCDVGWRGEDVASLAA